MPAKKKQSTSKKSSSPAKPAGKKTSHHDHGASGDRVANPPKHQHAFFVVGDKTTFIVHMNNLWMEPHRYQLVLRVKLPPNVKRKLKTAKKPKQKLGDNPPNTTKDFFVLANTEADGMPVSDLASGRTKKFQASVWRGWPRKEGKEDWPWSNTPEFLEDFPVVVEQVVYFRRLDFSLDYPRTANYILFGHGREAHIAHYVVKQPDFDHVATLAHAPDWLPTELLELAMPINFPAIPAIPGGHACHDAYHLTNPISNGAHQVQLAGVGPTRPIVVERTAFFGTFPINRCHQAQEWRPCKPVGEE